MYILARQTAETGMTAPPILAAGIAEDLISTMVGLRFMFCAVILAYGIYLPLQARLENRIG
jgi:biopolymer transport protein ExbB/TolQ